MEFSYRLSEAEYVQAAKLGYKTSSRSVLKIVMFWVFIMICLMLLWAVLQRHKQVAQDSGEPNIVQSSGDQQANPMTVTHALLINVGPFILLGGIWFFMLVKGVPMRLTRIYRNDPSMQGEFTLSLTPERISIQNTAGSSSQSVWNLYKGWREEKNIVVLLLYSGTCFGMSLANLSDAQRVELRGILTAALPKK